jgi:hypothetical protein
VKKLVLERGITSKEEIRRVLKSEFKISVNRQTVYSDFKKIGSISDSDFKDFASEVLETLRKNIQSLQKDIDSCESVKDRAYLMRTLSMLAKDEVGLASSLASGSKSVTGGESSGGVQIVFGEPVVDKRKPRKDGRESL